MSAATDALATLPGSEVDEETGEVTCFTHLMSDALTSLGFANFVAIVTGTSVHVDIGGVSHTVVRISDTQHTVVADA